MKILGKITWGVLTILTCCTVILNCRAAESPADSLKKLLFRTDDPKAKIKLYIDLAALLEQSHPDSSLILLKSAITLSRQMGDHSLLGEAYYGMGNIAVVRNQLDLAMNDYQLAYIYFKQKDEAKGMVRMDLLMGNIKLVRDDVPAAIVYYDQAIDLGEQDSLNTLLCHLYNNMGEIYLISENYGKALDYYNKAIRLFHRFGDSLDMAAPLQNTGKIYSIMKNYEMAKEYLNRSLSILKKHNDNINVAWNIAQLGMVESDQGNYQAALDLFNSSMEYIGKEGGVFKGPGEVYRAEILVQAGINYMRMGDVAKAKELILNGYELSRKLELPKLIILSSQNLSRIYEQAKDLPSALYFYKVYHTVSDSLSKVISVTSVKLIETRQEFEKKKKADELRIRYEKASKRRILIIYIVSGIVLLAGVIILILLLKLETQKKERTEVEKRSLNEKLDYQNKELTTNVMYLNKLNEQVVSVAEKLRSLDIEENSKNAKIIRSIIHELSQTSSTDAWKEFEIRFQKVHTDFYKKLTDKYPDLTANELRLCAFLKLNMSTKEISAITYQSENSIMVARTRLRQKLGISKYENLITFFSQF